MRREISHLLFATLCAILVGCDSGDIIEKQGSEAGGLTCSASVDFKNTTTWPVDYQIVIAAFDGSSDYPQMSKGISKPMAGDTLQLSMTGIPETTKEIAIVLQNKSRKRMVSFFTHQIKDNERKNNVIDLGNISIDLLSYKRIQNQFFSNCINCHGASEKAAAGLFLTEGKSYKAIVNVASTKDPSLKIVNPGLAEESFIIHALEGRTDLLHYDHTNVSFNSETEDITLLKSWINSLEQ